jgi:hypothetical protein
MISIFALDCANRRSLASVSAPALAAFLVPMPVLVASAYVGFINLDNPAKFLDVLDHGGSNLVAHEPSSLVGAEAHIPEDLKSAHALLADQHKVCNSVPVFQRLIRVLKDCAGKMRESVALIGASVALPLEFHRGDFIDPRGIASRAADALGPTPRHQIPDAIIFSLKQFLELFNRQLVDCFWMFRASHRGNLTDRKELSMKIGTGQVRDNLRDNRLFRGAGGRSLKLLNELVISWNRLLSTV